MTAPAPFHTLLLVGFMASGKSSVGRKVAELLDWELVDVDALIEARTGLAVEEIFRDRGEAAFRALEAEVTAEALVAPRRVVVPGGGWAVVPGRMESLGEGVLSVWLKIGAEAAVERAANDGTVRPLLEVPDPVGRARELLAAREPYYARARLHLDTRDTSPERLARAIVEHLGTAGGDAVP